VKKEILAECCGLFAISMHDLLGPGRFVSITPARFALYKALSARGWSRAQIGRLLNRDRSTVAHGISRAEKLMGQRPGYAEKVQRLIDFKPFYMQLIGIVPTDCEAYDTNPSRSGI
jgi:chromosomal replication initiation ATPase DnaA